MEKRAHSNSARRFANMDIDPSVEFLYRAMLNRDPNKRRVKPVPKHMIQLDFAGYGDDSDDSDFQVAEDSDNADEEDGDKSADPDDNDDADDAAASDEKQTIKKPESAGSDHEDENDDEKDNSNEDEEEDENVSSDDDDDEEEEEDEEVVKGRNLMKKIVANVDDDISDESDDVDYIPHAKKKKKGTNVKQEAETKTKVQSTSQAQAKTKDAPTTSAAELDTPVGKLMIFVCCVCLGDVRYGSSEAEDEIIECDNCGVTVHEGCYGISDTQSVASTESSASTEPWFCDACKANVTPDCELCPNVGGIFKETDARRWVHLVCALYIPGVAFGDVEKLTPVTLFEMPYSKWGAKECSLCEDSRFNKTGVCIKCDAGMCRTFFHVTCAQREGLLSEASLEEVHEIADPFFAYCKMHADKLSMRTRRRNFLTIQSRMKKYAVNVNDETAKERILRKLNRHRQKYIEAKSRRPPSWVPTTKMVRHLTSSPSAMKRFLQKAELMGIITQGQTIRIEKPEQRKKNPGSAAFSADFVNYFMGRNLKINNLRESVGHLTSQNESLQQQERILRRHYDKLLVDLDSLRKSSAELKTFGRNIWTVLEDIDGEPRQFPEILQSSKDDVSPTRSPESLKHRSTIIQQCGICAKTTQQHLLAKCDECTQSYHLGCLDPPLTRMPKKTKLMGWQCSLCARITSDDSDNDSIVDVNAPRQLRENIKAPTKFHETQKELELSVERADKKKKKKSSKSSAGISKSAQKKPEKVIEQPLTVIVKTPEKSASSSKKSPLLKKTLSPVMPHSIRPPSLKKESPQRQHPLNKHPPSLTKQPPPSSTPPLNRPVSVKNELSPDKPPQLHKHLPSSPSRVSPHIVYLSKVSPQAVVNSSPVLKKESPAEMPSRSLSVKKESPPEMPGRSPPVKNETPPEMPGRSPPVKNETPPDVMPICATCCETGSRSKMVSCDMCQLYYHFHCLDPPSKHTPKPRGYGWHCATCDPTDSSDDEDDDDDDDDDEDGDHREEN